METFERARVHAYFRRITDQLSMPRRPAVVLVTHLLPERSLFVAATARLAGLAAVLPKPKSADLAPALEVICGTFSGRILGVVEDTENGLRRYLSLPKTPCPVYSVARSPLKDPEDFLVGQSVVFSAEALIRERGGILNGRPACVIGFGKVGSSIARMLHAKNVPVTVCDTDPVRMAQALAQGFRTAGRAGALAGAGIARVGK